MHKSYNLIPIYLFILFFCSIHVFAVELSNERQNTIILPIDKLPSSWVPYESHSYQDKQLIPLVYQSLFNLNRNRELTGNIAESWSVNSTFSTYTVSIKPGLFFSNGKPVAAESIVSSFYEGLTNSPTSPKKWIFENCSGYQDFYSKKTNIISGLIISNESTLVFQLTKPIPRFLEYLSLPELSIFSRSSDNIISGTGPWIVQKYSSAKAFALTTNPYFNSSDSVTRSIIFETSPPDENRILDFETGHFDSTIIPESEFVRLIFEPQWARQTIENKSAYTLFLTFNLSRPIANSVHFRQALSTSISKTDLVTMLLNGHGTPLTYFPINYPFANDFNITSSKDSSITTNGNWNNKQITLLVPDTNSLYINIAHHIIASAKRHGITLILKTTSYNNFHKQIRTGNYDIALVAGPISHALPEITLYEYFIEPNRGYSGNITGFYNSEFTSLLKDYIQQNDALKQANQMSKILSILKKQLPIIPLIDVNEFWIHQSDIRYVPPDDKTPFSVQYFNKSYKNHDESKKP